MASPGLLSCRVAQWQERNQQKAFCCGLCTMKQAQAQGIIGSLLNLYMNVMK